MKRVGGSQPRLHGYVGVRRGKRKNSKSNSNANPVKKRMSTASQEQQRRHVTLELCNWKLGPFLLWCTPSLLIWCIPPKLYRLPDTQQCIHTVYMHAFYRFSWKRIHHSLTKLDEYCAMPLPKKITWSMWNAVPAFTFNTLCMCACQVCSDFLNCVPCMESHVRRSKQLTIIINNRTIRLI